MQTLKRVLLGIVVLVVVVVVLFLTFIGPWPTYKDTKFASQNYYKKALADIDAGITKANLTDKPGLLRAGWGEAVMTPDVGTPLGGLSSRKGKPSTGVRDELYARAACFSDGMDAVAIVGLDMLIVPPNIAKMAQEKIARETTLTAGNLLFTSSHTHSGPGGFAPGFASKMSSGAYDPRVPERISSAIATAVIAAYKSMAPAKIASRMVDAPQFIRNRTREAAVDSALKYLVIEKAGGERCIMVRYSAHPTILDDDSMLFSAEYPGELVHSLESATNAKVVYLGGAVGSMGPRAPEAPTPSDRIIAMGQGLSKLIQEDLAAKPLEFKDAVDVASVGVPIGMPPAQLRLNAKWRVSPYFVKLAGLENTGWVESVRLGDTVFIGMPFDFSGEIAKEWREAEATKGVDLWVSGFSNAYLGYLSPDRYYFETEKGGGLGYEIGFMNWFGPNTEAYMAALRDHLLEKLHPAVTPAVVAGAQ